jgi:hypothetical protein
MASKGYGLPPVGTKAPFGVVRGGHSKASQGGSSPSPRGPSVDRGLANPSKR